MISDQSQSAITGTKMSDSDLVSIAPIQDGVRPGGYWTLSSRLPHVNIVNTRYYGTGNFPDQVNLSPPVSEAC